MNPLVFALGLVAVVLLVYVGRYSGRVRTEARRFVAAPPEAVCAAVADLQRWQPWNPWLENARDVTPPFDGSTMSWDLPEVGRGRVRPVPTRQRLTLRQRLEFALPFAYRGRSDWQFAAVPGGTEVTWRFKGRVAFTLRAFATTVQGAMALDMRYGLDRLAATLEHPHHGYSVTYLGPQPQPACSYAQMPHRGPLDRLAADLVPCKAEVRARLAAARPGDPGPVVVHYLKTHMKLRTVECRVGCAWADGAATPDGVTLHPQPAHLAYRVQYEGPPEALEVAWYLAMQRLRVEQHQPHPQIPPSAHDDPATPSAGAAPGSRVRVTLHLPLRA